MKRILSIFLIVFSLTANVKAQVVYNPGVLLPYERLIDDLPDTIRVFVLSTSYQCPITSSSALLSGINACFKSDRWQILHVASGNYSNLETLGEYYQAAYDKLVLINPDDQLVFVKRNGNIGTVNGMFRRFFLMQNTESGGLGVVRDIKYSSGVYFGFYKTRNFSLTVNTSNPNDFFVKWGSGSIYPELVRYSQAGVNYDPIPKSSIQVKYTPTGQWESFTKENSGGAAAVSNKLNNVIKNNPFAPHDVTFRGYIVPKGDASGAIFYTPETIYHHQPGKKIVTTKSGTGFGALPFTVATANPGDTIEFGGTVNSGDTIFLPSTLAIQKHVYIRGYKNGAPIRITIVSNSGSAMYVYPGEKLKLENLTIANSAGIFGGAIVTEGGNSLELRNCTFANNTAGSTGGAIYFKGSSLTAVNCTFSGNITTAGHGGAIYTDPNATVSLQSCTFVNNRSKKEGGAVYFSSPTGGAFIKNSLFGKNTSNGNFNTPNDFNIAGNLTWPSGSANPYQSSGNNIFGSGKWYFNTVASDIVGSSTSPIDPQVGTLAANGVTNRPFTHALNGCGSPAVNAGSNDGALVLDQRGLGVSGGQRDIGAFELQPTDPSSSQPGVRYVTNGAADGIGSLKYTMEHLSCADTIRFRPANGLIGFTIFLHSIITPNNDVVVDAENYKIAISGKNQTGGLNRILEVGNRKVFLKNLSLIDVNRTGSSGVFSILNGGQLTLQGCLIKNNKATEKGSVAYLINGATLNVNNCTISGNEATEMGGVFYIDGGTLKVENSTIAYNKTTSTNSSFGGGAIAVSSVATTAGISIFNSIIAKNTSAGNGQDIKQALNRINATAGSHNIFGILEPGVSGTITHRTGDVSGTLVAPLDPQLQLLQFNGGPTQTHAIGCASIAYQTGLFNNTAGNSIGNPLVDQRQASRVAPNDKGAFEIGQGVGNVMNFHNNMIADTSLTNQNSSYKPGSLIDALLNICDNGTITADDSSTVYNASGAIINTRYRQYDYFLYNNKPIEITKNVTIDFNHSKLSPLYFIGNGANMFHVNAGKTLIVKNAWIEGHPNIIGNLGGFANIAPTGKIRFENCRITKMSADTGAVVYGGKIEAITCQFDNNTANIGNVFYSTDSVKLQGCTITDNDRVGHVIFMNGSGAKLVLFNNVIGDTGTIGATNARDIQVANGAAVTSQGYNLVSSSSSPAWGGSFDNDGVFIKNQANLEGVPSVTKGTAYRPACNSLALGSGAPGTFGLLVDINGNPRYNDRGAFERGTVRYVTNTDTSVNTVGSLPYVVFNTCDSIIFDRSLEDESIAVSGLHLKKPILGQSGSALNLYVKSPVRVNLVGNTPTRNQPVFYIDSVPDLNVTIDGLTFSANGGTAEGAAINSNAYAANVVIKNCTFTGCTSTNPNAMVISGRNITLNRSTIAYNTGAGAPVYFGNNSGVSILGSTIANNTTTGLAGGVAVNGSTATIANSIIAKNQFGSGGADVRRLSGTLSSSYNFVGVYNPAVGFTSSVGDTLGTAALPINPRLDTALKVNAGLNTFDILTLALTDTSSCINRANPNSFPADQRGFPTINGRNDIGAFEYNPTCMGIDSAFTDRIGPNNARLNFYGGNSSNYTIYYRPVDSTDWFVAGTPNSSIHQWSLSGLQTGVNYVWRIYSYCWGGKDSASSYVESYFTTQCSLPDSFWVSAQDTTSLGFTWTNMPGNSGYIVQLKNLTDTLAPVLSVTKATNDTTHLFTNIGYADEFECKLFTRCGTDTTDYKLLFANTDTIPYVKVIAPDTSRAFFADCSQRTVYWESYKAGNNFKIEVSYNNKASYTTLNANYAVVNNQKEYDINLPVGNYDSCFVRVTSVTAPALKDENDTAFRINNLLPTPVYNGAAFNMCKGSTQQLVLVPDTLHFPFYSWSLPFGYTGSSDSFKITITAPNFDTSGVIQVFARTNCDSSLVLSIPTTTRVTNVWTGASSIQWNNIANWSCNFVPGVTDNVEIPSGVPNMPTVPAGFTAQIGNLTIKPGATVTVVNTATLNVKLDLKVQGIMDNKPGSTVTVRNN